MSKIERLLNLTAVLLNTERPLTAKELRSQVEGYSGVEDGFARMFERDKDDLRQMGVPIEVKPSFSDPAADGYLISGSDYYLRDLDLTPEELRALNLAVLSTQISSDDASEAIWKLGGADATPESVEPLADIQMSPVLVELFAATRNSTPVSFTYAKNLRTICPWRLDFKRGRWYVVGYDVHKEAERNFRLDRIESEVETQADVEWVPATEAVRRDRRPWEYGDDAVTAKLWVEASRVAAARSLIGEEGSIDLVDNGAVFTLQVAAADSFYALVIDFLEFAEILEPPELRDGFLSHVRSVKELYV